MGVGANAKSAIPNPNGVKWSSPSNFHAHALIARAENATSKQTNFECEGGGEGGRGMAVAIGLILRKPKGSGGVEREAGTDVSLGFRARAAPSY